MTTRDTTTRDTTTTAATTARGLSDDQCEQMAERLVRSNSEGWDLLGFSMSKFCVR